MFQLLFICLFVNTALASILFVRNRLSIFILIHIHVPMYLHWKSIWAIKYKKLNENLNYRCFTNSPSRSTSRYFIEIFVLNSPIDWGCRIHGLSGNSWTVWKSVVAVKGDQKAPFSVATTLSCRRRRHSFPWIALLYPWYIPYIAEC